MLPKQFLSIFVRYTKANAVITMLNGPDVAAIVTKMYVVNLLLLDRSNILRDTFKIRS